MPSQGELPPSSNPKKTWAAPKVRTLPVGRGTEIMPVMINTDGLSVNQS